MAGRYEQSLALEEAVHLVVLQHGLHGSPKDYASLQPILASVLQDEGVHVVASQSNCKDFSTTHDGIDLGGVRLADEVEMLVAQCPKLQKISFIGHSLGGLYVRYCIGVLYARGFFVNIEPMNFISLATPHLGIGQPTSRGTFNTIVNTISSKLFDRTGAQLALRDAVSEETLALSSIHTLAIESRPCLPELSMHVHVQLPSPNFGFATLFGTLVGNATTWNVYMSHLDVAHPPLYSFELGEFDAILFVPEPIASKSMGSPPDNEDSIRASYYVDKANSPSRDTVLQLRGRHDGDVVAVDISIESTTDWAFVHGIVLRLGTLSCVTYDGDKLALRQHQHDLAAAAEPDTLFPVSTTTWCPRPIANQHLLQCLCHGAFLVGLHRFRRRALYSNVFYDVQAPYACSALRAFNPYRAHVLPTTMSPVYPHITLHSMENAAVLRASIVDRAVAAASTESDSARVDQKPKSWLHGLAAIPAYMFPVKKTTDANALPPHDRICHVVSKASDKVLVDPPVDTYATDPSRDVLRGMLVCVQSLEWERIDVLMESMMAHELIIAKRSNEVLAHESGLDIVHHVADTFVVE
ncbi:hypothetical protein H310_07427 [Aphanomyces invadans]|uniref:DUF676 domain-containing protein n=1 Tax=Aphanomyces invadans TaxID=157072 RepID=A0A024U272_9STRA|nr:hypothetical protein H310_07427 [Aphanomyces invadans]ETV99976.1 hypothetical protein H310_07427 [Aphanomyces invadans]|eukprot:XP_008871394.1 hypothetical protein H310_07427 [Aphanomyces invadans]